MPSYVLPRRQFIALTAAGLLPLSARAADPIKLLAYGDSLIHGYGLGPGEPFPDQLQAALLAKGQAVEVQNGGNSGDTTADGLARLDWTLAGAPDCVLLCLGANDALRGLDPLETEKNLAALIEGIKARGLPLLLAGMKAPRNLGADYVADFDGLFPRLAETYDCLFYPFFLDGVAAVPSLNQPDGLHPNAAGVATLVSLMLPSVEALLAQVTS